MKHRLSHIAKIIFAVCLAAALTLALFFGIARAGSPICQPDGRPAFELGGPPNSKFKILATDQNGKETLTEGNLDEKGIGTFPFGEPGVLYTQVLMVILPSSATQATAEEFKNVKCDAPQKPPQLATIELIPASVRMQVGEQRNFTATGKDQNGNSYPISNSQWTTSGGGTLSSCSGTSCTYTATQAGDFTISVTQGGVQGSASIHTTSPSQLASIQISPASVSMQTGQQRSFTATGYDQNGNTYTLSNPTWTTSGGGTLSPNGTSANFTATQAGDFTISVTQGGVQGTGKIQVTSTETPALTLVIGGVLALGIAAGAAYWLWGRPKV